MPDIQPRRQVWTFLKLVHPLAIQRTLAARTYRTKRVSDAGAHM
jgi:hypothetical protein